MRVELLRFTPNPEEVIAEVAADCYDSVPNIGIIKKCYDSGHLGVFEFVEATFRVEGVSRALTHQLVRKRMASYAQRSQRYVNETQFNFVTPPSIKANRIALGLFNKQMMDDHDTYGRLVDMGVPPEDARFVLPNACVSVINVHLNFHGLIDLCGERLCKRAQWEIRELVTRMVELVKERSPMLGEYLVPKCKRHQPHNYCTENKSCGLSPRISDIYPK